MVFCYSNLIKLIQAPYSISAGATYRYRGYFSGPLDIPGSGFARRQKSESLWAGPPIILDAGQGDTAFCWCCPRQGQSCHWKMGVQWRLGWLELPPITAARGSDYCQVQTAEQELELPPRSLLCFPFPRPWPGRQAYLFVCFVLPVPIGGSRVYTPPVWSLSAFGI